ncbi:hypothetical protein Tco_0734787 [Tanacetum coccineum]
MVNVYDEKVDFIRELEDMAGVDEAAKTLKFLNDNLWKDEKRLRKLRNMEADAGTKANEIERSLVCCCKSQFVEVSCSELHKEFINGHERRRTMEWSPMCEELGRAIGGRNWLHMMIMYLRKYADKHRDFALHVSSLVEDINEGGPDRRAFLRELRYVSCETVPVKTTLFLEQMMDKEGNRECKLRDLIKEAREMAVEIKSFLLKLMEE